MKRTMLAVCFSGLLLAGPVFAGGDKDKGEEVKLEDLPASVQQTLKTEAGDGQIEDIYRMTKEDGTVVYKAEVKKGSEETELKVGADGKVLHRGSDDDYDESKKQQQQPQPQQPQGGTQEAR